MTVDAALSPDDAIAQLFFTDGGLADPVPLYHHLRETAPVHHSATGAIFLTRFDDCDRVLRDNRFGKAEGRREGALIPQGDEATVAYREEQRKRMVETRGASPSMLMLDPPAHTRQRRLVSRAFTPRRVEQLRASIAGLADAAVARLADARTGDLLDLVGFPLPVAVIGTMVGVPEADWGRFRSLVTASAAGLEPGATLDELKAAEAAGMQIGEYFVDLVAQRRAEPADDLLSDLIAVVDEGGDRLTDGEVIATATLLFGAGFETTTNLIGNGVGALLRHPDQWQLIVDDPSLIPGAVDEVLRYDSPVQLDVRRALEPADLLGEPVADGQAVVTLLGAANHDPARFADPDRLDVRRDEGPPLSFAAGIHHCLGANLARVEGQEVLRALVAQCPTLHLDGDLVRRHRMTLRGYTAVPVAC